MKLMGIDIGTTGAKAAVFSQDGKMLGYGMETYAISFPGRAYAEQDAQYVWTQTKKAVAKAAAESGGDVQAISISAQGDALILLDREERVLAPVQLGMDYRAHAQVERLVRRWGARVLFEKTGMPPHPLNFFPKLMWVAENRPDILEKTWKAVTYADYMMIRFCGEAKLDATMAGRTMAVDLKTGDWDAGILENAAIRREQLSDICASGTAVGTIQKQLARELGLAEGVRLVTGGHDQVCAAIGAGVCEPGLALDSHGTAEVLSVAFSAPFLAEEMLEAGCPCYPHGIEGRYFSFGLNHTGGVGLQWFKELFGYASYDALMDSLPPEPTRLLTIPSLLPDEAGVAIGTISGLTLSTSRAELGKSLLEGMGYEMRGFLELFEQFGFCVEALRCVGGGARSPVGLQLKADVYGRPVSTLQTREAACLGAALLAGTAAGAYSTVEEAVARTVRTARTYEPDARRTEQYRQLYPAYLQLKDALRSKKHPD